MKMNITVWLTLMVCTSAAMAQTFRIVGYYSMKEAMNSDLRAFPFDRLTHVNLYFLNPDTVGNFTIDAGAIRKFITTAHKYGIKVLPSIGGGGRHDYYHALLKDDQRSKLVQEIVAIIVNNNFDGLDVDLEGSDIDENYEKFVKELRVALTPKKKLLTAAIAVFYKDQFSDNALSQYDFMNLMSYDHTGPWNPRKPGPHSTYEHAVADLDYFRFERKIPKEKLVLGVGFYGYGFGPDSLTTPTSMNYRQIVNSYPGAENKDELKLPTGATMYYNGISTIQRKTVLAKEKGSGIMIWQVMGDASGSNSLLSTINETIKRPINSR